MLYTVIRVIFIIANIFFGGLGLILLSSLIITKQWMLGVFLGGIIYLAAVILSLSFSSWWPLIIGFIAAHLLRLLGVDPGELNF